MRRVRRNTAIFDVERALKIPSIRHLTKRNIAEIDRVYFGHEFCERLLPDLGHFKRAIEIIRRNRLKLSLLTPSVTEYGLNNIRELLTLLHDQDEVVINDYGVLNMVEMAFRNPIVIGRVLSRIVVPTLTALNGRGNEFQIYLSLLGQRVQGLEVDSFNAARIDSFITKKIAVSLYRTRLLWTTTKRCAFNSRATRLQKFRMCQKECLNCRAIIENVSAKRKFLLSGNAIFGLDNAAANIHENALFKRVVFEPK